MACFCQVRSRRRSGVHGSAPLPGRPRSGGRPTVAASSHADSLPGGLRTSLPPRRSGRPSSPEPIAVSRGATHDACMSQASHGPRRPSVDQVAERIAAAQHGVVTRAQILSAGCAARTLARRVVAGRLRVIHRGVYAIGPVRSSAMVEMAAVLACGGRALVSHRSAGVLWRMLRPGARPAYPHVTLVGTNRARPGIRIHRVAELAPDERSTKDGIPITSPSRTLYDLARVVEPRALEQAVAEAIALRLVTLEGLAAAAERYGGRLGAGRFREVVQGDARPSRTRSTAEERFLALVRSAKVGRPKVNTPVAGHEVDFFWPEHRLVVEVDGRAYHTSPKAVERDRRRDADLATAGYRVLRITWREIVHHPEALLVRLGRALVAER